MVTPDIVATSAENNSSPYAGLWVRAKAAVYDVFILAVPILLLISFGKLPDDPKEFGRQIEILAALIIFPINLIFVIMFGATPGKMLIGLKIIDKEGNKPNFMTAVLRETVGKFVSGLPFNLGYFWIAIDNEHRGFHDKIAKTHVVFTQRLNRSWLFIVAALLLNLALIVTNILVITSINSRT